MMRLLRVLLFILGSLGWQWLVGEGSCRLDRIKLLRILVLLLVGASAIAELLSGEVVPNVNCSLLWIITLSIVNIDSVHGTTRQVNDLGKVTLSVAFWLFVSVSFVVERLDRSIGLLGLPGQIA